MLVKGGVFPSEPFDCASCKILAFLQQEWRGQIEQLLPSRSKEAEALASAAVFPRWMQITRSAHGMHASADCQLSCGI